jgi:alpha-ketoglutarate-dependent taurine dioxygenase
MIPSPHETSPKEPKGVKALSRVLVVSFALVLAGSVLLLVAFFDGLGDKLEKLFVAFGSALLPTGILTIFFEYSLHRILMREFEGELLDAILLERGIERLVTSGIVDCSTLRDRSKAVLCLISNAKQTIRVCKTWIPELEELKSGLRDALRDARNPMKIQVLCLDPDSPISIQRGRDLGYRPDTEARDRIKSSLRDLDTFCRAEGIREQVDIRTYRNLPCLSLYAADDKALLGWYWHDNPALMGPVLKVKGRNSTLCATVHKNFDEVWKRANDYLPEIEDDCIWNGSELRLPGKLKRTLLEAPTLNDNTPPDHLDSLHIELVKQWPQIKDLSNDILRHTKNRGYLVVRNFPFNQLTAEARRLMFLLLTKSCGTLVSHIPGKQEYVWEVTPRDVYRDIPTYSEHNMEATLHTDSNYRRDPEHVIAFLLERPATCGGGRTILLRIAAVLKQLAGSEEGRRCLKTLRTHKFPAAVPSVYSPSPAHEDALILTDAGTVRFRPDTIEEGMKLAPDFRTQERENALRVFGAMIDRSLDRCAVTLGKGDMIFINNHTVLHGRTAFEDKSRLLLRIRFNTSTTAQSSPSA